MSDRELLARAIAGDRAAQHALERRIRGVLHTRARRKLRCGPARAMLDVEDLVQEAWIALLREGGRALLAFDPSRGVTLESYVGLIAERAARGQVRRAMAQKRSPRSLHAQLGATEDPEHRLSLRHFWEHSLLRGLPERGLEVLGHMMDGRGTPREIAARMGVRVQVVYNWQHRIKQIARAHM